MTHDHRTMAGGPMSCHCYAVMAHGQFIATRLAAQNVAAAVNGRRTPGRPATLDFEGVEAITVAFADELVTTLHLGQPGTGHVGANPDVEETIQLAIRRRTTAGATP